MTPVERDLVEAKRLFDRWGLAHKVGEVSSAINVCFALLMTACLVTDRTAESWLYLVLWLNLGVLLGAALFSRRLRKRIDVLLVRLKGTP